MNLETPVEKKDQRSTLMVWVAIILHMLNHMISGAMPMLYPEIMGEFGLSYSQLGLLRSANTFVTGFPQMFVGALRRWTSGRMLLGVGNLINAVMNIFAAMSRGFFQFFGFRILGGLGSSPQHPVGASVVTSARSLEAWEDAGAQPGFSLPRVHVHASHNGVLAHEDGLEAHPRTTIHTCSRVLADPDLLRQGIELLGSQE